jgi:hypothetical protein
MVEWALRQTLNGLCANVDNREAGRARACTNLRGSLMLQYLKACPGTAFDSDDVRVLTAAFDKVWEAIQASGASSA